MYSIVYNTGLQAGEYPCGPIVANYLEHGHTEKIQFRYSVFYSAPVECKNWAEIMGNLKRIIGSFLGNKRMHYLPGPIEEYLHAILEINSTILHAVPCSQIMMNKLLQCQVFHSQSYLVAYPKK